MLIHKISFFKVIPLLIVLTFFQPIYSQKKKKSKKGKTASTSSTNKQGKSIKDLTKSCSKAEGLFTLYQDTTNGNVKLLIKKTQINKEFIYFSQIDNGVGELRAFRGNYKGAKVIKIQKHFNKIEFIQQNTSSYFDPNNALSKSAEANMPGAILASVSILGSAKNDSAYLVNANSLFLNETFTAITPPRRPMQNGFSFSLGRLSKEKSKFLGIRSYPANTDFSVEYVYSNPNAYVRGNRGVTDPRNVSIKVYHSFIEMPDNEYKELIDDPRVGYFITYVSDMTNPSSANYRDLVHRWHLVKKDTNATLSEPVEPIVWWMENTTPENLRPIIKRAAEQWNIAFEKAGFKNALIVKQQPDTAEWDAGDIRYNVLRWTASPSPPFGGYGPSFVNPRTGQILGADIMLEYRSVLGRLRAEEFYKPIDNAINIESEYQHTSNESHLCNVGELGAYNNAFGGLVLEYLDGKQLENSEAVEQYLHFLILHEIGHTLGLNHNMKSSQLHSPADIHNKDLTLKTGLTGSVMDYPSININPDRANQGLYFTMKPGPYDIWAIQFAYETNRTEKQTQELLNRSTEHELLFGNDADDMRSPGKAIDPRVNVNDMSSNAIQYGKERLDLTKTLAAELIKKYSITGKSHHDIYTGYYTLMREYYSVANVISRYIGGVYVDRAMVGQKGATKPYIPVELEKQKEAMKIIGSYYFSPKSFDFIQPIYEYMAPQRRGFNLYARSEDPRAHLMIEWTQSTILSHLLHPNTLQRISDSELYGNQYSSSMLFKELTEQIFKSDINSNVNSFRQNLQVKYTKYLIAIVSGKYRNMYMSNIQSLAIYYLKDIKKKAANNNGNTTSKAHKAHLTTLVDNALKEIK